MLPGSRDWNIKFIILPFLNTCYIHVVAKQIDGTFSPPKAEIPHSATPLFLPSTLLKATILLSISMNLNI